MSGSKDTKYRENSQLTVMIFREYSGIGVWIPNWLWRFCVNILGWLLRFPWIFRVFPWIFRVFPWIFRVFPWRFPIVWDIFPSIFKFDCWDYSLFYGLLSVGQVSFLKDKPCSGNGCHLIWVQRIPSEWTNLIGISSIAEVVVLFLLRYDRIVRRKMRFDGAMIGLQLNRNNQPVH